MAEPAPATATVAELRNAPTTRIAANVAPGFADAQSFELLQRGAKLLSASPLVPEIYRGAEGLPSCVIALNMALRMQADPLMVMQNLYVVHGRPSWSAQFLIACFNQCGRFSALRYAWQGVTGADDWGCRAWATEIATGEKIQGPLVTMKTAKDEGWLSRSGTKWKTIPELMLTYRAAAWMIRTHAPELAMGLPTAEESGDIIDITPERVPVDTLRPSTETSAPAAETKAPAADTTPKATETLKSGDVDTTTGEIFAPPSFAEIAAAINKAGDKDALDQAIALVASVKDERQKAELELEVLRRKKELGLAPGAK